jgi:succinate dehydrogenase/fumarate reductase flavoprotein subunit
MKQDTIPVEGLSLPVHTFNTLIIGSGAAGLNAALQLAKRGQTDIAVATEQWGGGTSCNAGSDKQTYYKLSLNRDAGDSPLKMAEDLFKGGCMHGDIALCEAQNSLQAFFHLVDLGVPFPHDRMGSFVGYKTDHDPGMRGTSAGPLTSQWMCSAMMKEVHDKSIRVFDRHDIIALITRRHGKESHVIGAVALNKDNLKARNMGFVLFNTVNIILATGGPAGMYESSVYPESQQGSTGLALRIGAVAHNLTESQFGLASIRFRWNVSGSYQQVIPRYISADEKGNDTREFLNDVFPDMTKLSSAIFLKGYQWPFDPRKIRKYGSSLIDILVYRETVIKGRRVFLDFTRNPGQEGEPGSFSLDMLDPEAYSYLEKSGALLDTPIQRLQKMNPPAVALYGDHGIDITRDPLEIAVCAQHNNGGLKGNLWWESNIRHLFPVGEVNGSHGVYRPGGSALNAGQVGSLRAALYIARRYHSAPPDLDTFQKTALEQILHWLRSARNMIRPGADLSHLAGAREEIRKRISAHGAIIRNPKAIARTCTEAWRLYRQLVIETGVPSSSHLPDAFKNLDICLTHALYLEAIRTYMEKNGMSRGSYLIPDSRGQKACKNLDDFWRFRLAGSDAFVNKKILEIQYDETGKIRKKWAAIRPIPRETSWFETTWKAFRENKFFEQETA